MSCGANFPDLFRRAGDDVDKVLRGANPADLPVEQRTKFDLVVNLTTARALRLTLPATRLAGAIRGDRMRRREFIAGLGAAAAFPALAYGQQSVAIIGVLGSSASRGYGPMLDAFRKGLSEAGYVEGKNVSFAYAWADDHYDRLPSLAAELARRGVNVILAASTPSALAAKATTSTIPIVFAIGGDPVRTGLVSSLNRPGGNITGAAHVNVDTAQKRLELLHELVPSKSTLGLMTNPTNPLAQSVETEVKAAAITLGLQLVVLHASTEEEIDTVFNDVAARTIGGLVIGTDPLFTGKIEGLGRRSLQLKVPAIYQYRDFAAAGGTISYGGDIKDSYYHGGIYTGRILRGEKPGDLPVQLSTKVELFVNLKAARAIGLEPTATFLARADEVIE
jgi:putative ABC transport system substrate-binding protein